MTCLPDRLIVRSWSSSASTPSRVNPPSRANTGGSSASVAAMSLPHVRPDRRAPTRAIGSAAPRRSVRMVADRRHHGQRALEPDEIARPGCAERRSRHQAFEVLHRLQRRPAAGCARSCGRRAPRRRPADRESVRAQRADGAARCAAAGCRPTSSSDRVRRAAILRGRLPTPGRSRGASDVVGSMSSASARCRNVTCRTCARSTFCVFLR